MPGRIRIGTAGWSIPPQYAAAFAGEGSHLERYAGRLRAVEINSSFYRPHRPQTYARWAASVPEGFRFAVKVPREITHLRRLADAADPLDRFLAEAGTLGEKLGPLLVQLPPSLAWEAGRAATFLDALRLRFAGAVACEPRHPSWFTEAADAMLAGFQVARVAADPAPVPDAARPGGWPGLVYRRLHGSPEMYYSPYSADTLDSLARDLGAPPGLACESWCIFDNTARGEAARNALELVVACRQG